MIVVKVRDRDIKAAPMGPVTTGSVGLPVSWHFSEEWDELAKTAVFRVGNDGTEITVAVLEDLCLVPDELLVQDNAGENLWIGVYGWEGEEDGEGNATIAMPTIWTYTRIQDGAQPSGIEPPEGTPGWSEQIQNATDEALRVAHGVAADAAAGEFDGISPAVTISDITHGHSVTITDREHPTGQSFPVLDGASAYEQAVAGGYEGTEAQFNAALADFKDLSEQAASSATAAASSATAAAGSATAAAGSATDAAGSATQAASSETAAAGSASNAASSATSASGSATAAASSATAAAGSASDAATAKTSAEAAQTAAAASAADASDSADSAASSATAAANSATAAGNAQTAAETAQGKAEDAQEAAETAQGAAETAAQSVSESAEQIATNTQDISDLKNAVQDLQYEEIAISSFTATPRQTEKGSTVTEVVLSYTLNKTPATLKLDGVDLTPASSGTETKTGLSLTENHSWTLTATDTGSPSHAAASDSETATLSFLNKAYWGADTIPGALNSAFVLGLANSVLTGTKARTITVNATSGKYIWYAVPTSFGTPSFKIGGFDGGFEAPATISLTNASGHTENYYVYRSTNPSLGNTTVVIS